ncbi:cofilin-like [Actinia tenebrosa]|uniref:Cofilin-like n=1 Tax=Actinia tenebrosa TaxID=6105 RepID=A0A6P8IHC5_ACTTE|nr:cofilin-like [Actinia tenebrosa]XP_031566065.1 cofilin-like [Actinia tenebrosa]
MSMSGIKVDAEATELFNNIKMKKAHKFAFFKISDDGKKIVIDKTGEAVKTENLEDDAAQWEEMKKCLVADEPRYVIYDFRFKKKDGGICEKMGFFLWCNDDKCLVKKKMMYAATKEAVKKAFKGFHYEIQATEMDDLDYSTHQAAVEKLR